MHPKDQLLLNLLALNPDAVAAYYPYPPDRSHVHLIVKGNPDLLPTKLPPNAHGLHVQRIPGEELHPLIAPAPQPFPETPHTACQNEPIKLGCQLQPAGGNWFGTAGALVRRTDEDGKQQWGILSNWHVMSLRQPAVGTPEHQPDTSRPCCAKLLDWSQPLPTRANDVDCAFADCLIEGFHTCDKEILKIGQPAEVPADPAIGLEVIKSGRTTGRTLATISAIDAVVRVNYGDRTCDFAHQTIITCRDDPFSAPGDSGSLVLLAHNLQPLGLLFAGGGCLTVANQIKRVMDTLLVDFQL